MKLERQNEALNSSNEKLKEFEANQTASEHRLKEMKDKYEVQLRQNSQLSDHIEELEDQLKHSKSIPQANLISFRKQ